MTDGRGGCFTATTTTTKKFVQLFVPLTSVCLTYFTNLSNRTILRSFLKEGGGTIRTKETGQQGKKARNFQRCTLAVTLV